MGQVEKLGEFINEQESSKVFWMERRMKRKFHVRCG